MKSMSSLLMIHITAVLSLLLGFGTLTRAWMIATPKPITNVKPVLPQPQSRLYPRTTAVTIRRSASNADSTTTVTVQQCPMEFVQDLLQQLSSPTSSESENKGQILLNASSEKWRNAIYQAIGAPMDKSIDTNIITKSLYDKMSRHDNQFAILLGQQKSSFSIAFPSDIVDYRNDNTVWLECQLRSTETNKLFVIMGIHLIAEPNNNDDNTDALWKILSLDWQDFREQFYPGLSGREWLRAF